MTAILLQQKYRRLSARKKNYRQEKMKTDKKETKTL